MKRTISVLAAGALGATLAGTTPASASSIDCATGGYTRVVNTYVPTNVERPGVDNALYNINGPQPHTYEICLDIPDGETFTIKLKNFNDGLQTFFTDDRPGDKILRYTIPANFAWQVHGTLTGPGSTFLYYTWHEKRTPA
ncbi:hypothetical protein ABZW11_13385 [Nonomuraea sp. NPDC004580]|uniref:hypothetical protein n=1 Tax=Nonomuraea sp. NPDC004580 TaxID=3154552 RepID=UPI0033A224DC